VQRRRPQQVQLGFLRRDPPLKHHPTRTCHGEQVAVPGGLGGVAGQGAVRAMVVDELLKVGEEVHWVLRRDADPGNTDRHFDRPVHRRCPHLDPAALWRELDRVRQQVQDDLPNLPLVSPNLAETAHKS